MIPKVPLNRRHKTVLALALLIAGVALVGGQNFQVFIGLLVIGAAFAFLIGSNSRAVHTLFLVVGVGASIIPVAIDWANARRENKAYVERLDAFRGRLPAFRIRYPLPDARTLGSVYKWALSTKPDGSEISIGPSEIDFTGTPETLPADFAGWDKPQTTFDPPWACYITREARQTIRQRLEEALRLDNVETLLKPGLVPKESASESKAVPPPTLSADFAEFLDKREKARAVAKETLKQLDEADSYPAPEWFEDAVRAGVDVREIPEKEKPGMPPTPFRLWAALQRNSIFVLPGMLFAVIGLGCLVYLHLVMSDKAS